MPFRLRSWRQWTRCALAAAGCAAGVLAAGDGATLRAADDPGLPALLQDELQRNLEVLRAQETPAYFLSFTVHDTRSTRVVASFGAVHRSDTDESRIATVQVRVGDYALDNTHPVRSELGGFPSGMSRAALPLAPGAGNDASDAEGPVRLALWRATDAAYKQATEALTRVKTDIAATIKEEDPPPDFSRETPEEYSGEPASLSLDTALWEERLRRVSAVFSADPLVLDSDVSLQADAVNWYYVNSEGSRIRTASVGYRVFIQAGTRASDGMELPLFSSYFARTPDDLPGEDALLADARGMLELLGRLREAPLVEPFSGPAILSGRAAGVFFHEIFGHRVEGHRQRDVDDGQTFAKRVDQAVLPPFLSVVFDPTERQLGDTELMGHYLYDDEGVEARRVTLVESGVLRTFLLDRTPLAAFPRSNGHGRAAPGFMPVARQSNLLVRSTETRSFDALLEQLKEEARRQGKPFGLLFDSIQGGFTTTGRSNPNAFNVLPNVVYRIYTDDRPPELVRGVDLIGTPLAAFGKILATGDQVEVFNGMCGAESGNVPVSAASPALLVGEVEVQKKAQSQEALPILPAPVRGLGSGRL